MKFHFYADTEFEADDLDDAFLILGLHFLALQMGGETPLEHLGELGLSRVQEPVAGAEQTMEHVGHGEYRTESTTPSLDEVLRATGTDKLFTPDKNQE